MVTITRHARKHGCAIYRDRGKRRKKDLYRTRAAERSLTRDHIEKERERDRERISPLDRERIFVLDRSSCSVENSLSLARSIRSRLDAFLVSVRIRIRSFSRYRRHRYISPPSFVVLVFVCGLSSRLTLGHRVPGGGPPRRLTPARVSPAHRHQRARTITTFDAVHQLQLTGRERTDTASLSTATSREV